MATIPTTSTTLLRDESIQSRTRQVFLRVAVNGEKPDDVAAAFGINRNAVDQIKNRMMPRQLFNRDGLKVFPAFAIAVSVFCRFSPISCGLFAIIRNKQFKTLLSTHRLRRGQRKECQKERQKSWLRKDCAETVIGSR